MNFGGGFGDGAALMYIQVSSIKLALSASKAIAALGRSGAEGTDVTAPTLASTGKVGWNHVCVACFQD